jgi:hypothetical protein
MARRAGVGGEHSRLRAARRTGSISPAVASAETHPHMTVLPGSQVLQGGDVHSLLHNSPLNFHFATYSIHRLILTTMGLGSC